MGDKLRPNRIERFFEDFQLLKFIERLPGFFLTLVYTIFFMFLLILKNIICIPYYIFRKIFPLPTLGEEPTLWCKVCISIKSIWAFVDILEEKHSNNDDMRHPLKKIWSPEEAILRPFWEKLWLPYDCFVAVMVFWPLVLCDSLKAAFKERDFFWSTFKEHFWDRIKKYRFNYSKLNFRCQFFVGVALFCVIVALNPLWYWLASESTYAFYGSHGKRIVALDIQGRLPEVFSGWQELTAAEKMRSMPRMSAIEKELPKKGLWERITDFFSSKSENMDDFDIKKKYGYNARIPSISVIEQWKNPMLSGNYATDTIVITDRNNLVIWTDMTPRNQVKLTDTLKNSTLIKALLASEDKRFEDKTHSHAFEFKSFARAVFNWVTGRKGQLAATSTITQQTAKILLQELPHDKQGNITSWERTPRYGMGWWGNIKRKHDELMLASALNKKYEKNAILEYYINHTVACGKSVGFHDIARMLFNKKPDNLTDAEAVYLARLVRFGNNNSIPRVIAQCKADMPNIAKKLGWDSVKVQAVEDSIQHSLLFARRDKNKANDNRNDIRDLANKYWRETLKRNGHQVTGMSLQNPNSPIRYYGSLNIKLTVDLPLQNLLDSLVNTREFGDTTFWMPLFVGDRLDEDYLGPGVDETSPVDTPFYVNAKELQLLPYEERRTYKFDSPIKNYNNNPYDTTRLWRSQVPQKESIDIHKFINVGDTSLIMVKVYDQNNRPAERHLKENAEIGRTAVKHTDLLTGVAYVRVGKDNPNTANIKSCVTTSDSDSCFVRILTFYKKRELVATRHQYYAYAIMDSKTGKLLAYRSPNNRGNNDTDASYLFRVGGIQTNAQNASSTAKPILNALSFDFGIFKPASKLDDSQPVTDSSWEKKKVSQGNRMTFRQQRVTSWPKGLGNVHGGWDGSRYVYEHLEKSNNIVAAEIAYRLSSRLDEVHSNKHAQNMEQYLRRIGRYDHVKNELGGGEVTGIRLYKELGRVVGVPIPTDVDATDYHYAPVLGTIKLSLYQQMHLFNILYANKLFDRPEERTRLVVEEIIWSDKSQDLKEVAYDSLKYYRPFSDLKNIHPALLGLHNRLLTSIHKTVPASKRGVEENSGIIAYGDTLSNFAKSGTVGETPLRAFNSQYRDVYNGKEKKTTYLLWNAVLRVDMSKFSGGSTTEIKDITIAAIAERNIDDANHPKGGKKRLARNANSVDAMHGFLTTGLLDRAGVKVDAANNYFSRYEREIQRGEQ